MHVCEFLGKTDPIHGQRLVQLMTLMNDGKCPVANICYKIFEDLIQWHTVDNISQMRYSEDVRLFWLIVKRLFHQKFLQFMHGLAFNPTISEGQVKRGLYDPQVSEINFPLPNKRNLNVSSSHIPSKIPPGVMGDMIDRYLETLSINKREIGQLNVLNNLHAS